MPRSVNSVASRRRRKKLLELAKGFWGKRKNVLTVAKHTIEKGLGYAYRDRKTKKTPFPCTVDTTYQCRCPFTWHELLSVYW
jgi:large subunit ribosomal protein L20